MRRSFSVKNLVIAFAAIVVFVLSFSENIYVSASSDELHLLETKRSGSDFYVYLTGVESLDSNIEALIGTSAASVKNAELLDFTEERMRTLILIDNSKSIGADNRKKIKEMLNALIEAKAAYEDMGIAVFVDELTYLCKFTNDSNDLSAAIDNLEYQKHRSYLTDVLYKYIEKTAASDSTGFNRIIVISDGADHDEVSGYTDVELSSLLETNRLPIYCIGCVEKKNADQLKKLFAFSRQTDAKYFNLQDDETSAIAAQLNEETKLARIILRPSADAMDGTDKMLQITVNGQSVSTKITMPQALSNTGYENETTPVVTKQIEDKEKNIPKGTAKNRSEDTDTIDYLLFILIGCGILLITAAVIIPIVLVNRKKKKTFLASDFNGITPRVAAQPEHNITAPPGNNNMGGIPADDSNDNRTVNLWNTVQQGITLKALETDGWIKTFGLNANDRIVIGRDPRVCSCVIDFDKSVSSRHCEISYRDGRYYLTDLGSTNGTKIDGISITNTTEIRSGSVITMGRQRILFETKRL